jgi:hypothetical protein
VIAFPGGIAGMAEALRDRLSPRGRRLPQAAQSGVAAPPGQAQKVGSVE